MFLVLGCSIAMAQGPSLEWAIRIGSTGNDSITDIVLDGSGNIYAIGYYEGTVDFDPGVGVFNQTSAGMKDVFVLKLDQNGGFLWARTYGGDFDDIGTAIAINPQGSIVFTGIFEDYIYFDPPTNNNFLFSLSVGTFVSKLDPQGGMFWARVLQTGNTGSNFIKSTEIACSITNQIYTTGYFYGVADFNPLSQNVVRTGVAPYDAFVSVLDVNGLYYDVKTLTSTGANRANDIRVDPTGKVYLSGFFGGTVDFDFGNGTTNLVSNGTMDAFFGKFDNNLGYTWAGKISGSSDQEARQVAISGSGNMHVSGTMKGITDFDPSAGLANLPGDPYETCFTSKYSSTGQYQWGKSYNGGMSLSYGNALELDAAGNEYMAGNFSATLQMQTLFLISAGDQDALLQKHDASGNLIWAVKWGGTAKEEVSAMALTNTNEAYVAGIFGSTVDFNPGTGTTNLASAGGRDIFISKLALCSNTSSSFTQSACESYTFNGQTYTASGVYTQTLPNSFGCDSTITLNLTIRPATTSTLTQTACGSYYLNGQTYTATGTYSQLLTNTSGCDSMLTLQLTILPIPTSAVTQTSNTLSSTAQGAQYQWVDCNAAFSPIVGATGQSFTPTQSGSYAVIVSQSGCSDTSACFPVTVVGLASSGQVVGFTISPNPAIGNVRVECSLPSPFNLKVFDGVGRLLIEKRAVESQIDLQVLSLSAGTYFIELEQEGSFVFKKLVLHR